MIRLYLLQYNILPITLYFNTYTCCDIDEIDGIGFNTIIIVQC